MASKMDQAGPPVAVATTTWDAINLIESFLIHYQRLGASAVFVMEYGSTDGTRDVLSSSRWSGFVEVVELPTLAGKDTSNDLLPRARSAFPDGFCLFCDPDEFLVTPQMRLADVVAEADAAHANVVTVGRRNMTARAGVARDGGTGLSPGGALTLRIDRQVPRSTEEWLGSEPLSPPWIFTEIPGKVLVRLSETTSIGSGDHSASQRGEERSLDSATSLLLHYPFRTFAEFAHKVEQATVDFSENKYSPFYAWQYHRWIKYLSDGTLEDEFMRQFIPDEDVPRLLSEGAVAEDLRVRNHLAT
jgi:hypothetical protein